MADSRPNTPQLMETIRKVKKRPYPPVCHDDGIYEEQTNDFLCPICFEMISAAHMAKCGHTFCYDCITSSLEYSKICPKCNNQIESVDEIYPKFLFNELITKQRQGYNEKRMKYQLDTVSVSELQQFLNGDNGSDLTVEEINNMLDVLAQKKQQIEAREKNESRRK